MRKMTRHLLQHLFERLLQVTDSFITEYLLKTACIGGEANLIMSFTGQYVLYSRFKVLRIPNLTLMKILVIPRW